MERLVFDAGDRGEELVGALRRAVVHLRAMPRPSRPRRGPRSSPSRALAGTRRGPTRDASRGNLIARTRDSCLRASGRRNPRASPLLLAALVAAAVVVALVTASTTATAGQACAGATGANGYSYAGHQATYPGHGVRATLTLVSKPNVASGHVAGWVGVGGPGQGANGEDAWIQAGVASMPGMDPFLYAEITREGRAGVHPRRARFPSAGITGSPFSRCPDAAVGGASGWTVAP